MFSTLHVLLENEIGAKLDTLDDFFNVFSCGFVP